MDYILKLILLDIEDVIRMRRLVKTKIMKIKEEDILINRVKIRYNNERWKIITSHNNTEHIYSINPFILKLNRRLNEGSCSTLLMIKNDNEEILLSSSYYMRRDTLKLSKVSDDHYRGTNLEYYSDEYRWYNNECHYFNIRCNDIMKCMVITNSSIGYIVDDTAEHRRTPFMVDNANEHSYTPDEFKAIKRFIEYRSQMNT